MSAVSLELPLWSQWHVKANEVDYNLTDKKKMYQWNIKNLRCGQINSLILSLKESTSELNNKRSGKPQNHIKVDDHRIVSLLKKNSFVTSIEVKNALENVSVSMSKSTIKRHLEECTVNAGGLWQGEKPLDSRSGKPD